MERERILVVDDEQDMLRSTARVLSSEYEVEVTTSPEQALEWSPMFRPHLAIVDIRMPRMDGFILTHRLKELDPHLQVILMTGSLHDTDRKLIRAIEEEAFYFIQKPFDRDVLKTLIKRCLRLRQLDESNRRHIEHLEEELALASAFQLSMLPDSSTTIGGVSLAAAYKPCSELAGDLYDYAEAEDGAIALLIADVVGHGAQAAMLTAMVKSAFRSSQQDQYDPVAVIHRVADGISAYSWDRFVTVLCARIDPARGQLDYVNAGHEGGLIKAEQHVKPLAVTGPLVSPAITNSPWDRQTDSWDPTSLLLLYTDGICEAWNQKEMFGCERIGELIRINTSGCRELVDGIMSEVDAFCSGQPVIDDLTLLAAQQV